MKVYFDNAATTPIRNEVIDLMIDSMTSTFGNPSSSHGFGRKAKSSIENARKSIAKILNCDPQEIIFTSGGTESDNMVLRSVVKHLGIREIISSKLEHHAILNVLEDLEKEKVKVTYVDLDQFGSPKFDHLENLLKNDNNLKLVSLMHVNNEIGNILDLKKIVKLTKSYGAYFHTDAVQGVGHYQYDLKSLPIDFLSASGHKFHGPKGIGFSFIRKNIGFDPLILGGPQEKGLRAGTEPVHNIIGIQKAIEISYDNIEKEKKFILDLKKYFIKKIKFIFPKVYFNGSCENLDQSSYTIVNISLPIDKTKVKMLDFHMDLNGVACSKGSACQAGAFSESHVLTALRRPVKVKNYPSLRFSFSSFNTKKEVDHVIKTLSRFIEKV